MNGAAPKIPDFELLRPIGRGGYGEVWLARSITGVWRAVKVVDRARFTDSRPFDREFAGVRSYQRAAEGQPHQLALLHVGRDDARGIFHYVMELADDANDVVGGSGFHPDTYVPLTLKELRLRRGGAVPISEVVRLALPLARSLAFLHAHRLIHRDVKPSNIVLVQGVPKLADLGLVTSSDMALTSVGTPGYAPPEGPGTMTADRYSLGKVVYQLATGLAPSEFPKLPTAVVTQADAEEFRDLNEVLLKSCATRVEDRYPTTEALVADLELLQAGKSLAEFEKRRRQWRQWGQVLAVLAVVSLMAAGLLWWRKRAVERQRLATRVAEYQAGLAATRRALEVSDFGSAAAELARLVPPTGDLDLRGFEWRALAQEATGNSADSWRPTNSPIVALAVVGTSNGLLAATGDGSWFGRGTPEYGERSVTPLKFDSVPLLSASSNGGVFSQFRGWARWRGADSAAVPQPGGGGTVLDFARDQQWGLFWEPTNLAPATNAALVVRDLSNGGERFRVPQPELGATLIAGTLANGGQTAALAWFQQRDANRLRWVDLWDLAEGKLRWRLPVSTRIDGLSFSADSGILAIRVGGNRVRTVNPEQGAQWAEWTASALALTSIEFSPTNELLATAGEDQIVEIWDARSGNRVRALRGHRAPIRTLRWSPAGQLHSAADDGEIRTWPKLLEPEDRVVAEIAWSDVDADLRLAPDGRALIVRNAPGRLAEFDPVTLRERRELSDGAILPIGFSPTGSVFWSFSQDWRLQQRVWPAGTIVGQSLPLAHWASRESIVWSATSRWLVMGSELGQVHLWPLSVTNGLAVPERTWQGHAGEVTALSLSGDGQLLATGASEGTLRVWTSIGSDSGTGTNPPAGTDRIPFRSALESLSWAPDGRTLAMVLADGGIVLEDLKTGKREETPAANRTSATAVVFLPDGSRLVTGGRDGRVTFWGLSPLRPLLTEYLATAGAASLLGPSEIATLTVSADSSTVAALGRDGRVRIWRSRSQ